MTFRQLTVTLIVLIALGLIIAFGATFLPKAPDASPSPSPTGVACTMDAKICPDGSAVGRIPPNCQFAQCPVTSTSTPVGTSTVSFTAKIGQRSGDATLSIIPLEVVEDSQCAIDVQCIQAGTVRLLATVAVDGTAATKTFILGTPVQVGTRIITLTEVRPEPRSTVTIAPASYSFVFVARR